MRCARSLALSVLLIMLSGCGVLHAMQGRQYRLSEECADAWNHHHSEPVGKACEWIQFGRLPARMDHEQPIDAVLEYLAWDTRVPTVLAYAYDRGTVYDVDALHRAIGALPSPVDDELRARFDRKRRAVTAAVDAAPQRWRDVFLAPALRVRAAWRQRERAHEAWAERAAQLEARLDDVLLSKRGGPALLATMTEAHRGYVAECRRGGTALEACLGDDVARRLTHDLIKLAHATGDELLAQADNRFLDVPDRAVGDHEEHAAALAAVQAEAAEWSAWKAATGQQMDAGAIARRWPQPPVEAEADMPVMFGAPRPDRVYRTGGSQYQVERIERRGERAVLTFRKWVTGGMVGTNCHLTNRVERILPDGGVVYREACTGQRYMTSDHTAEPAEVPWREVAAVRRFEVVTLVLDAERHGRVIEVHSGNAKTPHDLHGYVSPLVQVRDLRVDRPSRAR